MKKKTAKQIELHFKDKITRKEKTLNLLYDKLIMNATAEVHTKLTNKRNRQLQKYIKLQERNRDRELKNLAREEKGHTKVIYKKKEKPINKTKVLEVLQLLCRVESADEDGNVVCISSGVMYRWDEVCGGHYETRTNNATAFLMTNIHPQSHKDNQKMSWSNNEAMKVKERYKENLIKKIGKGKFEELANEIQQSRYTVNKLPDKVRLQEIYDRGVEQILKHIKGKNIVPKKNTLLDKLLRANGIVQTSEAL